MRTYVILHNIRSAHNVGSILRTADGAGVTKVFLTGYTPAPIDRFGREQAEILKTSLGAAKTVVWQSVDDIHEVLDELEDAQIETVAVEQHTNAIDHKTFSPSGNTAYIFGNETEGITEDILIRADHIIEIPMRGSKESLNVAIVAGIVLFNTR